MRMTFATFATFALLTGVADAAPNKTTMTAPRVSAPAPGKVAKPRSAASKDCSSQADAKGLHGKARQTFRNTCKRQGSAK